jgi:non-specific serine/threonine protein kinase
VLDGVASLVSKSLLEQRTGADGAPRFWMLETIHEYAGEKLAESGEGPALARRHAAYFLTLAEEAEPHLRGEQQVEWLARLEDEHENLRAVLAWALAEAPGEEQERLLIGLRLIGALEGFWRVRGHYSEGRRWVAAALEREAQIGGAAPVEGGDARSVEIARAKAGALYAGGRLAWQQGDEDTARGLLEESLAISRRWGYKQRSARALNDLGILAANQGDNPAARAMWEESLGLCGELNDKRGAALALGNLGYLSLTEGDPATALPLLEESLSLLRELGEKSSIATGLGNVGIGALQQADYAAARALLNETLALCLELEDKSLAAQILAALASVEMPGTILPEERHDPAAVRGAEQKATGDPVRAATLLGAAAALLESIGAALDPMENRIYEQAAAAARALLGDEAFEAARQAGRAMTMEQATAYARQQE